MALVAPYNQGNPGNYKQSNLWDTPWAKEAWNNKNMLGYANQMGGQANNYLTGGNNPISGLNNQIGGYAKDLWGQLGGAGGWGGSGGGWGGSFTGYGNPNDPRIGGHMANLRGGRSELADQYAKQTNHYSGAGMRTAGGVTPDQANRMAAMSGLGSRYSDDYGKAMGWTLQSDSLNQNRWSSQADLVGKMLGYQMQGALGAGDLGARLAGLQLSGLQGQNDWDRGLFGMRREDYNADANRERDWMQNEWKRQREYKNAQQADNDAQLARDQEAYKDQLLKNFSYPRSPRDISPSWMGDLNYWLSKRPFYQGSSNINTQAVNPSTGMTGGQEWSTAANAANEAAKAQAAQTAAEAQYLTGMANLAKQGYKVR